MQAGERNGVVKAVVRNTMRCEGCGLQVPVRAAASHDCETVYFSEIVKRTVRREE